MVVLSRWAVLTSSRTLTSITSPPTVTPLAAPRKRLPGGLADIEGGLQPEPDDLHRGAAVRVAAHLAAGRLPHSGLFRGGATADRCPHLERHLAAADPAG